MSRFQILRRIRPATVVPAVLAGAIAVTGVNGLAPEAPAASPGHQIQLAGATEPTDGHSYDMSTGVHTDFGRRYDSIINDIRNRIRGTRLYGNVLLAPSRDDYFPVTLRVGQSQITLVFNAKNLYVVGWLNPATNRYYRFGEGPSAFGRARTVNLSGWINYGDMERAAGIGRGSLGISMGAIQGSISDLGSARYTTAGRDQARAILILVQAFAEGARLDFISYRVSQAIRHGDSYHTGESSTISSNGSYATSSMITVTGLTLENDWRKLSKAAQDATHRHTAPHFRIGSGYLNTMSAIDAQLAVALRYSF